MLKIMHGTMFIGMPRYIGIVIGMGMPAFAIREMLLSILKNIAMLCMLPSSKIIAQKNQEHRKKI